MFSMTLNLLDVFYKRLVDVLHGWIHLFIRYFDLIKVANVQSWKLLIKYVK